MEYAAAQKALAKMLYPIVPFKTIILDQRPSGIWIIYGGWKASILSVSVRYNHRRMEKDSWNTINKMCSHLILKHKELLNISIFLTIYYRNFTVDYYYPLWFSYIFKWQYSTFCSPNDAALGASLKTEQQLNRWQSIDLKPWFTMVNISRNHFLWNKV